MPDSPFADESFSDFPAIVTAQNQLTYRELESAAARVELRLREDGVAGGDVVGVALGQTVDALVLIRALIRMGAVACMINPRWPRKEIDRATAAAGCARFIDRFDVSGDDVKIERAGLDVQRPATVIFTSGSTGEPRPALHSVDNHFQSARASNANIVLKPGDRWLLSLPLHHVAGIGILFRCAISGAAVAVPDPDMPLARALDALRPTHLSLVPTQLRRLLDDPCAVAVVRRVKAVLMGGAPMPENLVRHAVELALPIHTSYGLTETSSQITATRPGDRLDALMTSGAPLTPGTVAVSSEGEILVRGATLFLGYIERGNVRRPLDNAGWFHTGDLGRFDGAGRLIVTGRRDNMFISGGENVQPEEIEQRLCELPGVEQALVVPVPDDEYGEVGAAFVKMAGGAPVNGDAIARQLRELMPAYKIPKHFRPWPPDIPDSAHKTARRIIARAFWP